MEKKPKATKPASSKVAKIESAAQASGPMRINKYLALKQYASRRGADELITNKRVTLNGRLAVLGDTVGPDDVVEVKKSVLDKEPLYFAYNKPIGVLTHSAGEGEQDIAGVIAPLLKGQLHKVKLFPLGRLDKDSHGLIILTNDGRITSKLLDPEEKHEKVYIVQTKNRLSNNFEMLMQRGVVIQGDDGDKYKTKPCQVKILGDKKFSITLTEGKKRQIRRMCEVCGAEVTDLERVRIMNIELGYLSDNNIRKIKGEELEKFLKDLGMGNPLRAGK